jgi:hypothetical protein
MSDNLFIFFVYLSISMTHPAKSVMARKRLVLQLHEMATNFGRWGTC